MAHRRKPKQPSKFLTSFFIFNEITGEILLSPSKSTRRMPGQYDPVCTSKKFVSTEEQKNYIVDLLFPLSRFAEKNRKKYFSFLNATNQLTFIHKEKRPGKKRPERRQVNVFCLKVNPNMVGMFMKETKSWWFAVHEIIDELGRANTTLLHRKCIVALVEQTQAA